MDEETRKLLRDAITLLDGLLKEVRIYNKIQERKVQAYERKVEDDYVPMGE